MITAAAKSAGLLRMVLAPCFQVRDVFLVQFDIHKFPAGLIAEPAAHPRREITRLCRRHYRSAIGRNSVRHLRQRLEIVQYQVMRPSSRNHT